jgi:peptidyl-prolyl cis-trans isomerase B (cyclophilin B)
MSWDEVFQQGELPQLDSKGLRIAARKANRMKLNDRLSSYQAKQNLFEERKTRAAKDNRVALIGSAAALLIALAGQFIYFNFGPGYVPTAEDLLAEEGIDPATPPEYSLPSPDLAESRIWNAELKIGDSDIALELDGQAAPQAVANFVYLAQQGFYENVKCHRLVTAGIYVLQCGDPVGDGTGGPGYSFGPIENAPAGDNYLEGHLAMARRGGDGNSMGSQFFIVYQDSSIPSDAAGGYTVFGKVTAGLDAIKTIAEAGTADGGTDGAPASEVLLSNVSVE